MTDDLDVAIRHVRTVALWHPTLIRRAPIGMYYLDEDRRIRLRGSDQVGLDVRTVALWHPTLIRRAPIGMYCLDEDRRIRLRVSDQVGLDDYGVWVPARGDDWAPALLWSPSIAAPGARLPN